MFFFLNVPMSFKNVSVAEVLSPLNKKSVSFLNFLLTLR